MKQIVSCFSKQLLILVVVAMLVTLAACQAAPTESTTPTPTPGQTTPTATFRISITLPEADSTVPAGDITVVAKITPRTFKLVDKLGEPSAPDEGHLHFYLDVAPPTIPGQPAVTPAGTFAATNERFHTWEDVAEGTHTLAVQLVNNDHTPFDPPVVAEITVTSSSAAGQSVTRYLTVEDRERDKDTITVPAGALVTLILNNKDDTTHGFQIRELGTWEAELYYQGDHLLGPRKIVSQFRAPTTPGDYQSACGSHWSYELGHFIVTEE